MFSSRLRLPPTQTDGSSQPKTIGVSYVVEQHVTWIECMTSWSVCPSACLSFNRRSTTRANRSLMAENYSTPQRNHRVQYTHSTRRLDHQSNAKLKVMYSGSSSLKNVVQPFALAVLGCFIFFLLHRRKPATHQELSSCLEKHHTSWK